MKYGIREICDVVLKAKANQKLGNKIFYKGEPVLYFDTLKTSTMEGAATTVYAQGGRGNSRLVAWEGERTVTFTMEDALISPIGFSILSGAGLVEAGNGVTIKVHTTETLPVKVATGGAVTVELSEIPYVKATAAGDAITATDIYVMALSANGEVISEPYIPTVKVSETTVEGTSDKIYTAAKEITLRAGDDLTTKDLWEKGWKGFQDGDLVLVDYYIEKTSGAQQIEITPDKFGGNYYLEASTLFRTTDGVDVPAEFIIPNCKIQSNFTFTMASSGDPSTFTFTMDAFPDYLKFDQSKKVLAAIQILDTAAAANTATRGKTKSEDVVDLVTGAIKDHDDDKQPTTQG